MYRVLRPGGRAVMDIGEKVADGTETHRILGAAWVWSEDDARRLAEEAGFADISLTYRPSSGNGRSAAIMSRLTGQEELRLVLGVKRQ